MERRILGILLLVLGVLVLLAPGATGVELFTDENGPLPPPGAVPEGPTFEGKADDPPSIPDLAAGERDRALDLVGSDETMQALLKGRSFTVKEIGPWTTEDRELIGASMVLGLTQPATFPLSRWPVVDYDPAQSGRPYDEATVPLAAGSVTELMVRVDLKTGEVVSIEPGGKSAVVSPGPGIERVAAEDPGY